MSEKLQTSGDALNEQEVAELTALLKRLKPGVLPFSVFHEVTRLVATPIIEMVPMRVKDGKSEVLLLPRDDNDPIWPGQLHVPGTVVRSSDKPGSFDDAFNRIFSGEISKVQVKMVQFVLNLIHHSGRGMEVSQVFWAEVEDNSDSSEDFYPSDILPLNLVESQRDFIPAAIESFNKYKQL